jgi:hypothetical protein
MDRHVLASPCEPVLNPDLLEGLAEKAGMSFETWVKK